MKKRIKFIDLFAGIGGIRLGFEQALRNHGFVSECVMTSEIKPHAIQTLERNFDHNYLVGDITKIDNAAIPEFDFLLAGFPCQPFSSAGNRHGFSDTRGTLFFDIERILRSFEPHGFILENVEGLVKHDLSHPQDEIGNTLRTILNVLEDDLGYNVTWGVFDSLEFGLPQSRKRIFIVGSKGNHVDLTGFEPKFETLSKFLDSGQPVIKSKFTELILSHFDHKDLYGKSIKDKRGGENNIHSWDIELKGTVSREQVEILNKLFKERRKKHWANEIGIKWMDGMPLTLKQISTFHKSENLRRLLDDLVEKGYLRFEYPKGKVEEVTQKGVKKYRKPDLTKPKGYNIVTGKLSFEFNKILDPNGIAPTLVATDVSKLAVVDGRGLRKLTKAEGLKFFGFPEDFVIPGSLEDAFDLLGNTVAVPVVKEISERLIDEYKSNVDETNSNQPKSASVSIS